METQGSRNPCSTLGPLFGRSIWAGVAGDFVNNHFPCVQVACKKRCRGFIQKLSERGIGLHRNAGLGGRAYRVRHRCGTRTVLAAGSGDIGIIIGSAVFRGANEIQIADFKNGFASCLVSFGTVATICTSIAPGGQVFGCHDDRVLGMASVRRGGREQHGDGMRPRAKNESRGKTRQRRHPSLCVREQVGQEFSQDYIDTQQSQYFCKLSVSLWLRVLLRPRARSTSTETMGGAVRAMAARHSLRTQAVGRVSEGTKIDDSFYGQRDRRGLAQCGNASESEEIAGLGGEGFRDPRTIEIPVAPGRRWKNLYGVPEK